MFVQHVNFFKFIRLNVQIFCIFEVRPENTNILVTIYHIGNMLIYEKMKVLLLSTMLSYFVIAPASGFKPATFLQNLQNFQQLLNNKKVRFSNKMPLINNSFKYIPSTYYNIISRNFFVEINRLIMLLPLLFH